MGTSCYAGQEMKELYEHKKSGFVNFYKNDYQMLIKTAKKLFSLRASNFLKQSFPRTEDGYFIYKFGEIYNKFVKGKTNYRHIDPS